jgi:hypothetical protein
MLSAFRLLLRAILWAVRMQLQRCRASRCDMWNMTLTTLATASVLSVHFCEFVFTLYWNTKNHDINDCMNPNDM